MKQKTNKLAQFKQWILSIVVMRYCISIINLLFAIMIIIIGFPFRMLLKLFGVKTNIAKWLDANLPILI